MVALKMTVASSWIGVGIYSLKNLAHFIYDVRASNAEDEIVYI